LHVLVNAGLGGCLHRALSAVVSVIDNLSTQPHCTKAKVLASVFFNNLVYELYTIIMCVRYDCRNAS